MKRIKWNNLILLMVILGCACVVIHDVYMLTIYTSITGNMTGLTSWGLISFVMCLAIGGYAVECLKEKNQ